MPALCKCENGHTFTARVLDDDPTVNSFVTNADNGCPECGAEFEVIEVYTNED